MGAMSAAPPAAAGPEDKSGISLCFTADQAVYNPGQPIHLSLTVANHTASEVLLSFKDAQRFDFRLEQAGREVWRWSQGRMFAQMLGQEKLSPGAVLTFSATCQEKLAPGLYRVTGTIVAHPGPLAASLDILVR